MDVVELDQLDQTHCFAGVIDGDKTAFALIVYVLVVELRQFRKRFIGLFEPVTHDLRVVVHCVHEAQIVALQRP
jgi:hypothetical protein